MGKIFLLSALVAISAEALEPPAPQVPPVANGGPGGADVEWQKLETRPVIFRDPRHILSAGLFDRDMQHVIDFPNPGASVDLELPHAGKDKNGKDFPPIMARLAQGYIWVDVNGDGKPESDETKRFGPDGFTDPFTVDLHYDDGTSGTYTFVLKTLVEGEKYLLQRAMSREAMFQGVKLQILDDDGNGKYSDTEHDVIVVGDSPPALVGKYVSIGEKFYEVVVHAAGTTIEIRPAPKLETGIVDIFQGYKPSQKAENLTIHNVMITGPGGSFAFDERHRTAKVPVGAYDMVFGLFERAKEWVYMKKGERTSFAVNPNRINTLPWGGTVTAKFNAVSDGTQITVDSVTFHGEANEQYFPESYKQSTVQASLSVVFTDQYKIEHRTLAGAQKFKLLPDGELSPIIFKAAHVNTDYEIAVEMNSGILGTILSKQKLHFIVKKKTPDKK